MKDIDFDELDRAVTSLLGKPVNGGAVSTPAPTPPSPMAQGRNEASSQSVTPQLPQRESVRPNTAQPSASNNAATEPKPTAVPASTPISKDTATPVAPPQKTAMPPTSQALAKDESARNTKFPITPAAPLPSTPRQPEQTNVTTSSPSRPSNGATPPPARRPGGRFMDVVHPSAGNRAAPLQKTAQPHENIKDEGNASARPPVDGIVASAASSSPLPSKESQPSRISHTGKQVMPASNDTDTASQKSSIDVAKQPEKVEKPKSSPLSSLFGRKTNEPLLTEKSASHPETAPSARKVAEDVPSPFLTDAKVQKRPLGGLAGGQNNPLDKQSDVLKGVSQQQALPAKKPNLPLESKDSNGQLSASPTTLPPELDQDIVAIEASEPNSADRPDTPPAFPPEEKRPQPVRTVQTATQAATTAAASIPQQYRAKQTETDKTPRSIYDTEEYHKPLPAAQPKKKKSHPVVWILVIILLLALGAGLGVAVYFLFG